MEENKNPLKPPASVLIKLGSIIVHYQEYVSSKGHELDKLTAETLLKDPEVSKWMEQMENLTLLPLKR